MVPPPVIRDCIRLLKKNDKERFMWMTEVTEGYLDSDEEDALHKEIDCITLHQETLENKTEDWWEKHWARSFNQLALNITDVERAYTILQHILCCSFPAGIQPDADPMLSMENVSRALVVLGTNIRTLDLDKAVAEVHDRMPDFRLLMTPKERANSDKISGKVRFSTLIAASSAFRQAILHMDVDAVLCLVCKSSLSEIFDEKLAR
jgi:hypothetical protein